MVALPPKGARTFEIIALVGARATFDSKLTFQLAQKLSGAIGAVKWLQFRKRIDFAAQHALPLKHLTAGRMAP
jgi:hypothetical protein